MPAGSGSKGLCAGGRLKADVYRRGSTRHVVMIAALRSLLIAACLAAGFFSGRWMSEAKHYKELAQLRSEQSRALSQAFDSYHQRIELQRAIAQKAINEYQAELKKIRNYADHINRAGGLRLPESICANALPTSASPIGHRASTAAVVLPDRVTADLRRLA